MTFEQLKKAATAQPFRPFAVVLADGRSLAVPRPDWILVPSEAQRTFVVFEGDDQTFSIIDLLLVTSLDFSNGRATRRRRK